MTTATEPETAEAPADKERAGCNLTLCLAALKVLDRRHPGRVLDSGGCNRLVGLLSEVERVYEALPSAGASDAGV